MKANDIEIFLDSLPLETRELVIALRTIVIRGSTAYVQAGAGIVADSVPANEFQETLNKARGLLKAIEIAEKRAAGGDGAG